ncbi:M23 family metallopeptidase [Streptomyces nigra]|uniref:M23 family metallopeptidase n=1 Tax=Streptomyces nigra TaxID=1827580 RepID=UPI003451ECA0
MVPSPSADDAVSTPDASLDAAPAEEPPGADKDRRNAAKEEAARRLAERRAQLAAVRQDIARREEADRLRAERERPAVGDAAAPPSQRLPAGAGQVIPPLVDYQLTAGFGDAGARWSSGHHTGLDFAASEGTEILAVSEGTVTRVSSGGALGNHTVLSLADGTQVRYSHQRSIAVKVGQKVETGDVIGAVGTTGNSTGPHLHLEIVDRDGDYVDPAAWFEQRGVSV